jgi:hypothetical protein
MPTLDVVIVGVSENISKIYYERAYVEGDDNAPDCFSLDGIKPDAASPKKQNETCALCPQNQFGSRITPAGKRAKACQDSRRIAVVPLGDILNEGFGGPMLLRIPPTSLPNLARYAQDLERKGVGDLNWVGTRLGFDHDLAYPRITFEPVAFITEEQDAQLAEILKDPVIHRMLHDAGPTESEAAPVADDKIPGTPPRRANVTPLRRASDQPETPPESTPQLPPQEEPPDEEEPPAAIKASPFAPPARRGRPPKNGPAPNSSGLSKAPGELENAINDLLDH